MTTPDETRTMYRSSSFFCELKKVQVGKTTDKCVWVLENWGDYTRHLRTSGRESYWDTWAGAHGELLKYAREQHESLLRRVENAKVKLMKVEGMEETNDGK